MGAKHSKLSRLWTDLADKLVKNVHNNSYMNSGLNVPSYVPSFNHNTLGLMPFGQLMSFFDTKIDKATAVLSSGNDVNVQHMNSDVIQCVQILQDFKQEIQKKR